MILKRLYAVVIVGLVASAVAYGATANDIVRKAHAADGQVSYRGIKVACISVGGRSVTSQMQITHLKPDMTRTQYSSPKVLAGVVVVQRGRGAWRYSPREKTWDQLHNATSTQADPDLSFALANYSVRLLGSAKAQGLRRDAWVVLATPKRAGEPTVRVWIDKKTYLTLRTQTEKPGGGVTSSSTFTSLTVNPAGIRASLFAVPMKAKPTATVGRLDFRVAKPKYMPKGYKLVGQSRDKVSGHSCVHLQFSNGVNTISLFERRSAGNSKAPKVPDRFVSVMTWTRHQVLFTLIGELPRAELQKIADSTL